MHKVNISTIKYNSCDEDLVTVYLYNHNSLDTIRELPDNYTPTNEENADLAIYYYYIGEFDKSKYILLLASTPYSYINYAILYDNSYFKVALDSFSDNADVIYHYMENSIMKGELSNIKENLGSLFKKKDCDIGSHIFNLGFMFQDQLSDYKSADVCFKFMARLNPKLEFNEYWIKEGIRCSIKN